MIRQTLRSAIPELNGTFQRTSRNRKRNYQKSSQI